MLTWMRSVNADGTYGIPSVVVISGSEVVVTGSWYLGTQTDVGNWSQYNVASANCREGQETETPKTGIRIYDNVTLLTFQLLPFLNSFSHKLCKKDIDHIITLDAKINSF